MKASKQAKHFFFLSIFLFGLWTQRGRWPMLPHILEIFPCFSFSFFFSVPSPFPGSNPSLKTPNQSSSWKSPNFKDVTYRLSDRPTYTASSRVACTRLKTPKMNEISWYWITLKILKQLILKPTSMVYVLAKDNVYFLYKIYHLLYFMLYFILHLTILYSVLYCFLYHN